MAPTSHSSSSSLLFLLLVALGYCTLCSNLCLAFQLPHRSDAWSRRSVNVGSVACRTTTRRGTLVPLLLFAAKKGDGGDRKKESGGGGVSSSGYRQERLNKLAELEESRIETDKSFVLKAAGGFVVFLLLLLGAAYASGILYQV